MYSDEKEQKLVNFYKVSRELFKKGNFNIRQWASNSKEVMKRAKIEIVDDSANQFKVLGMIWEVDTDRFLYTCAIEWNGQYTKRAALSFCCKIFDPLGFIAWLTTRNKIFLQTLWKELLKWDESFEFLKN